MFILNSPEPFLSKTLFLVKLSILSKDNTKCYIAIQVEDLKSAINELECKIHSCEKSLNQKEDEIEDLKRKLEELNESDANHKVSSDF